MTVLEQRVRLPAWRRYAACAGRGDLFFATDPVSEAIACAVCGTCGVLPACRAQMLEDEAGGDVYGTRAGLTSAERRAGVRRGHTVVTEFS